MKTVFYYLIQVIVASGILYAYYHFALRNKKFHHYNRFYLLLATVISIIIPFLSIPVYFSQAEAESSFVIQSLTSLSVSVSDDPVILSSIKESSSFFTIRKAIFFFYSIIAVIIFLRIIFSLLKIKRLINNNPVEKLEKIKFVNTTEPGTPFSFFRWLFWNKKIDLQSENGEQIFRHELFHIEQKHSRDIIYMELLTVLFWINPFFHLIKKELKAIHEFLADKFAVKENKNWEYAELLLMQILDTRNRLVNPFFHNQIKRRIAMITTSKKPSYQYLRKLMVLPLLAVIITLFAFNYKRLNSNSNIGHLEKPITVIIDAGHGGEDPGGKAKNGLSEKELTLAIAQKIKSLNEDNNLTIVLTRDSDSRPDLKTRADLIKEHDADLFLSIHVAASNPESKIEHTGFEVFVSKNNKQFEHTNNKLASILVNNFSQTYETKTKILQREQLYLLDNAICPSALIECGYITNEKDLQFIKEVANQEKIANDILKSIYEFAALNKSKNEVKPNSNLISDTTKPVKIQEKVIDKVDVEVTFPGGSESWKKYLMHNLDGMVPIKAKTPKGTYTVVIQFIVDKEGYLSDVKALTNHGYGMEEEAVRVIKKGPRWNPASLNGKKVSAYRKQPITYIVNLMDKKIKTEQKNNIEEVEVNGYIKTDPTTHLGEVVVVGYGDETSNKNEKSDNKIFDKVEEPPSFPGGKEKWLEYLSTNAKGTVATDNGAPDGIYKTIIQFIVHEDGTISDAKAITNNGFGMEAECLRLITNGPKWIPAKQNGKIVKAYVKQTITFQVMDEDDGKPEIPTISINTLRTATAHKLLQLPENTVIESFTISTDLSDGTIVEQTNISNTSTEKAKNFLKMATVGKPIYFDNITIGENGQKKKIPSVVYKITN